MAEDEVAFFPKTGFRVFSFHASVIFLLHATKPTLFFSPSFFFPLCLEERLPSWVQLFPPPSFFFPARLVRRFACAKDYALLLRPFSSIILAPLKRRKYSPSSGFAPSNPFLLFCPFLHLAPNRGISWGVPISQGS